MIIIKSSKKTANHQEYKLLRHKHKNKFLILPFWQTAEEQRLYRLRQTIRKNMSKVNRFFTLTLDNRHLMNSKGLSAYLRKFWNRLKNYVKTKNRHKKLEYVWKIEWGKKSGRIHVHAFTNFYFPKKKLEEKWGLGFCQPKLIRDKKMAKRYVSKYFSKAQDERYWAGGRSFGKSRGLVNYRVESQWECVEGPMLLEDCIILAKKLQEIRMAEFRKLNVVAESEYDCSLVIS